MLRRIYLLIKGLRVCNTGKGGVLHETPIRIGNRISRQRQSRAHTGGQTPPPHSSDQGPRQDTDVARGFRECPAVAPADKGTKSYIDFATGRCGKLVWAGALEYLVENFVKAKIDFVDFERAPASVSFCAKPDTPQRAARACVCTS